MKKHLILILFVCCCFLAEAQKGVVINGSQYTNGSYAYIPCGEQTVTVAAWSSTAPNVTILAEIPTMPSGWTRTACGNNCSTYHADISSGGLLRFKYNSTSSETDWVYVYISRNPLNHFISGPNVVCTNATYSFSGSFYTGSPVWTSSNPSVLSINSSTGAATVHGNGAVTIYATVTTNCGSFTTPRTVHAGKATVEDIFVSTQMCNGYSQEITATLSGDPTFKQWSVTSGNAANAYLTDYSNGRCYFNSYINDCYGLQIQMTNTCGSSLDGTTVCVDNCLSPYKVFPNPADDFITVQFEHNNKTGVLPDFIKLYNEKTQQCVRSFSKNQILNATEKNGIFQIPVKDLIRGTYYLHIPSKSGSEQKTDKIRILLH